MSLHPESFGWSDQEEPLYLCSIAIIMTSLHCQCLLFLEGSQLLLELLVVLSKLRLLFF